MRQAAPPTAPVVRDGWRSQLGHASSLGYMIWNTWEVLSVEAMYVGMLMIALMRFLITFALNEIAHWIIPWKSDR